MSIQLFSNANTVSVSLGTGNTQKAAQGSTGDFAAALANAGNVSKGLSVQSLGVTPAAAAAPVTKSQQEVKDFMKYMNESVAEKFEDAWLAQHHLTRDDLKHMSPEKRKAITDEMAEDFKKKIQQKADDKISQEVTL